MAAGLTEEYVHEITMQIGNLWQSFGTKKGFDAEKLHSIFSSDIEYAEKFPGRGGRTAKGMKQLQAYWIEKSTNQRNVNGFRLNKKETFIDANKFWANVDFSLNLTEGPRNMSKSLSMVGKLKFNKDGRIRSMTTYSNIVGDEPANMRNQNQNSVQQNTFGQQQNRKKRTSNGAQQALTNPFQVGDDGMHNPFAAFNPPTTNNGGAKNRNQSAKGRNGKNGKGNNKRQRNQEENLTEEQIAARTLKKQKHAEKMLAKNPNWDICFAFTKKGECKQGDKCQWRHEMAMPTERNSAAEGAVVMDVGM